MRISRALAGLLLVVASCTGDGSSDTAIEWVVSAHIDVGISGSDPCANHRSITEGIATGPGTATGLWVVKSEADGEDVISCYSDHGGQAEVHRATDTDKAQLIDWRREQRHDEDVRSDPVKSWCLAVKHWAFAVEDSAADLTADPAVTFEPFRVRLIDAAPDSIRQDAEIAWSAEMHPPKDAYDDALERVAAFALEQCGVTI